MKVLHLLNSNHFSGAENVVCQIIGLFKDDQNIKMIYCSPDGQIREALEERSIDFEPVECLSVAEVRRIIRKCEPDVIHAHDMRAGFFAALVCGSIPLVSHIHNNAYDSRRLSLKSIAYSYAAKKAKHIFWVSQSAMKGYVFNKIVAHKSSVLQNIIDIDALYKRMKSDVNNYNYDIAYVGRLAFEKNPERLMNVLRLVKMQLPNVKIAVIGTGDLEAETKNISKEYGLQDNVSFLGFQLNPLKILNDSKVMVMTSRWEGLPMCALEAMALGVPIVSTPVDGLKQLIVNGENGYILSDDNMLSQHIVAILKNENLYRQLSSNQVDKSTTLNDLNKYKNAIEMIYKQCLQT